MCADVGFGCPAITPLTMMLFGSKKAPSAHVSSEYFPGRYSCFLFLVSWVLGFLGSFGGFLWEEVEGTKEKRIPNVHPNPPLSLSFPNFFPSQFSLSSTKSTKSTKPN